MSAAGPRRPPAAATVLSIIDLGSNSLRMDVVALQGRSSMLLRRERRMVRLGDGLFARGRVDRQAVGRVEEALEEFMALHRALGGSRLRAVATAAMRAAREAPALVRKWERRFGVRFDVISGSEEAALIAKGVLNCERPPAGVFALMDLGGGSTEVVTCRGRTVLGSISVPLGANRAQQVFLKEIPPTPGGVLALRREVRRAFAEAAATAALPEVREVIGSGGTVRALRRMARAAHVQDHPYTVRFLSALTRRMERRGRAGLMRLPGMADNRVDLILGGAVLLEEAALSLGAERIRATEAGLRDGLLADELARISGERA